MRLNDLTLEIILSIVQFIWIGGWWILGHLLHYSFTKKSDILEPLGIVFMFLANVAFFYIARHVLNFVYKKQLPGGADFTKEIEQLFGQKRLPKKNK
jgi:uncharacterized membrane protein YccF (DUF307 family)